MDYVGRKFVMGETDCYALLRDYYQQEYGIELSNFARPEDFWEHGLDLYGRFAEAEGFELFHEHPVSWRRGDVILMAVMSEIPNHVGIVQDDGQILHHMYGRLSVIEPYRGIWRNTTVAVYRHKLVDQEAQTYDKVELLDLLPAHIRKKLDDAKTA